MNQQRRTFDTFGYKSMEEKVMEINPEKKLNLLLFVKK